MKNINVATNSQIMKFNDLLDSFTSFIDVAPLSVRSYTSGIKQFFYFMQDNGIISPTHDDVIYFKKSLLDTGKKPATVALYKENEPLFISHSRRNSGQRLTTRTISGVAKKAMINAGFNTSRLTAHSLRHTAITLALMAGQSLADVQAFARHTSINTTMIYNHTVNRMRSLCESVIANQIF